MRFLGMPAPPAPAVQKSVQVSHGKGIWRKLRMESLSRVMGLIVLLVGMGSALITMTIFHVGAEGLGSCTYYTVQPGDVLWRIGVMFDRSVMTLARASGIQNPNLIFPGQQICVPGAAAVQSAAQPESVTQSVWQGDASSGSVQSMIEQQFGANAGAALNVARCESGFDPSAYNPTPVGGSHAEGVFQILYPSTWDLTAQRGYSPYDAQANIAAAYALSNGGTDWHLWACQP
jgi:LysM repeat protein